MRDYIKFSPSYLDRLRAQFVMSELIGKRIAVKKHGREFHALCPFHNEKTPSFTINDEKGFYHCFGCGAHGDAIGFVMQYDRLTYPEAVTLLAREAGLALPQASPQESQRFEQEKTLYDVLECAASWFSSQLSLPAGDIARHYITKRNLTPETLTLFRIGYAPDERQALHQHLIKSGFPQNLQVAAGLVIQTENGTVYDRFRGRVIFPIRNASGKVIAFGGRLLPQFAHNKQLPKYLNSPETELFRKGELLYNIDLAKRPARDGNMAVVMEGYMDVVSTAQAGITYATATLGTAVTPDHLRLLWRLAHEPVVCLDGDAAGSRAMMRAVEVALPLLKPGFSLRFAVLPKDEDPDTYIQKNGKAAFEKLLSGARRLSQIIWDVMSAQYTLDLPESRAALDGQLNKVVSSISDATVRQHYQSYFRKQLWAKASPTAKNQPRSRSAHIELMAVREHSATLDTLARRLLKTLLQFPSLLHKSHVEETLSHTHIHNPELHELRDVLLLALQQCDVEDRGIFMQYIEAKLSSQRLAHILSDTLNLPYKDTMTIDDALQIWEETVSAYQVAHMQAEMQALQEEMGQTVSEEAYGRLIELQQAIQTAQLARRFAPNETDFL